MLPMNPNQEIILEQARAEIRRINHDIADQIREYRAKNRLFAQNIVILSGGAISPKKLEQMELECLKNIPWESLVALGLLMNCRLKVTFEPIPPAKQSAPAAV